MYENYSVLFVDDEINILNSLQRGLIDEEYQCFFASSGVEALKILETEKIAVIVSDMRMPEMDGLALLKEVRVKFPQTVRIVLSGYAQLQQILLTINQADIFKFITKPWKLSEEFTTVISQALNYYILNEENESYKQTLQARNELYQNMLKTTEMHINNAKKSKTIASALGISLITYNKNHLSELNKEMLECQEKIFEYLIPGIDAKEKELQIDKIEENLSKIITSKTKINKLEKIIDNSFKTTFFSDMFEATLSTCLSIFFDEFSQNVLDIKYTKNESKGFVLSLSCNNILSANIVSRDAELKILERKIELINSIVNSCIMNFNISIHISKLGESLSLDIATS